MIGETLEMSQGKSRQILASDTDKAKPAQNVEQKTRLLRTQPGAQIHPRQTQSGAAFRQRALTLRARPEQFAQSLIQILWSHPLAHIAISFTQLVGLLQLIYRFALIASKGQGASCPCTRPIVNFSPPTAA
jgi:hypothetical protein